MEEADENHEEGDEIGAKDDNNDPSVLTFRPTKSTAEGCWQAVLGLVQMRKLRGNFWKKCGFTVNGTDFLYPEEALSLYERKLLAVFHQDGRLMDKKELFEASLRVIPLSCYLAYAKLKAMDYIVVRHRKALRLLSGDAELQEYLLSNPTHRLLDAMVSYDLFIDAMAFSKKAVRSEGMAPLSYVVLTDGQAMFSPRVLLTLLAEADGVPVLFAVISSTGTVMLQEVTDAARSIKWPPAPRTAIPTVIGAEKGAVHSIEADAEGEAVG